MKSYFLRHPGRVLLICLIGLSRAQAQEGAGLDALMDHLEPIQTLKGDFQQVTRSPAGELAREQSGQFWLARPDHLYWHSQMPFEQVMYIDGETVWLYEPDLMQATRQPLRDQIEQSPALVLTGNRSALDAGYRIEKNRTSEIQVEFQLTPRDDSGQVRALTLAFLGDTPRKLTLLDSFDQTTVVQFDDLTINAVPPDGTFRFEPPAGIDVLEQAAP